MEVLEGNEAEYIWPSCLISIALIIRVVVYTDKVNSKILGEFVAFDGWFEFLDNRGNSVGMSKHYD